MDMIMGVKVGRMKIEKEELSKVKNRITRDLLRRNVGLSDWVSLLWVITNELSSETKVK